MDLVGPIIEIVKLVGGPVVRYLKYHIKYNDYLKRFNESKEGLCSRKPEIESRLEAQLQLAPYNVARPEVEEWLKDANDFMARQDVEEEVSRRKYLSCCCRAVILEERTQELKAIHDRGDRDTTGCLVIEDPHRKLDYYVQNFKELKEKLQRKLGDIGSTLGSQLVHGKIEREEVKHWQKKVKEIIGPIAKAIEDEVDKGDYLSHPSDPLTTLLREKIEEMDRICEEGSRLPECLVIDDPSAWAVELPVPELQGSEAVKAKILAWLKGEEVTKLGVWGMGGVGKTTIMKHVHNVLLNEGKFKKIIWVTVSQNFDTYTVQDQIASSLKEELDKRQSTVNRAAMLSNMIEKHKPYLLIFDDVWKIFELNEVGIPEPEANNGCKLVLTTRLEEIARSMGCNRIKVDTLSQEEALGLFLDKVGATVLSGRGGGIKSDLESTLKMIVDECDGLPLAIVTVASSLKEISEPQLWSAALNQLRDCKRNVAGTDNDAFRILMFSYDHLKNPKIQYCFLYCALYPEDYIIPKEEIIEYWIDEGFIDEMETRHAMKDEGHHILRKLEGNCLLEYIEDRYEGDCVRMHDLIRDMALDIARTSPRFLVEAGKRLIELPEKVTCTEDVEKVSLMCNYIEEIPSSMASSACTRLTTLLLAHNKLSTIPESVFEHMPELKILDLSFNKELRSLPNSASKLVHLATLLLERTSIEEVPFLSGLGSLKRLNLRGTAIKEVPEGLRMLTNLKCLALCGSYHRYSPQILEIDEIYHRYSPQILEIDEIANGVLSNLSKLEELFIDWSRIELKGEVVGRLMKLEVFHGLFPTVNEMRIFLKCQLNRRLSSYFITVGSNLGSDARGMIDDAKRMLPRCKKIMVFNETSGIVGENVLFPSIQILCLRACQDVRSLNDFSAIKDETVTDLRGCCIKNCDSMEWVLSTWINNSIVQTLEYLFLEDLQKLDGLFEVKVIAKSPPPRTPFSFLKVIRILHCHKIKKLFPSWKLVEYLQSLEKIDVRGCKEMEEIIASDPEEEGEEGGDIIKKLILPKLNSLFLLQLPALKSICSGKRAVTAFDSLEWIDICVCGSLRGIFVYLPSTPFSSLKTIKIENCNKIKKLFPSWKLVEYLPSLEKIDVFACEEMEEIIASDPEEGRGDIIKKLILPKLKELRLSHLRAFKSICSGKRAVMACDSLERIEIGSCKGLRGLFVYLPSPPYLFVSDLDKLDGLFEAQVIAPNSPPPPTPFSSLKTVGIYHCHKIKKLFPSWKLVEYLPSLERISVGNCEEMEEIIASDHPEEEGEEGGDIIKKLILPKLKRLELRYLPALKSICGRKRAIMACDSLESIDIRNCGGIRGIFVYLPSPPYLFVSDLDKLDGLFEAQVIAPNSPPPPTPFSSLKTVGIYHCHKIKKLFPSWKLVEYLQSLERISVGNCEEMEEIIASDHPEEGEEGGDIIKKLILPKLKKLELRYLPALKSICGRKRAVMVCDSLEEIEIRGCEGLKRIPIYLPLLHNAQPSPPPSLKKIHLDPDSEEWWESLEWDHQNAKDVLQPMVHFDRD